MTILHVLFDAECALCRRCCEWLAGQPAWVALHFIPFQEAVLDRRFADLRVLRPDLELVVVADTGEVWQGGAAWVMCLWATRNHRSLAATVAHPMGLALARGLVAWLSRHRKVLSGWLGPAERACLGACGSATPPRSAPPAGRPEHDQFHEAMVRARITQD